MLDSLCDNVVISDASCLIGLTQTNQLDILQKLYKNVYITPEVKSEYKEGKLPDWIIVKEVKKQKQSY